MSRKSFLYVPLSPKNTNLQHDSKTHDKASHTLISTVYSMKYAHDYRKVSNIRRTLVGN